MSQNLISIDSPSPQTRLVERNLSNKEKGLSNSFLDHTQVNEDLTDNLELENKANCNGWPTIFLDLNALTSLLDLIEWDPLHEQSKI